MGIPHETPLIATIAAGVGLSFIFGLIAARLRMPLILGYILAGVAVGPFTPGFVADKGIAHELSEIGVTLLMFGVGLHFSIKDLMKVRGIAIPGAIAQIVVATALGAFLARAWGWSWAAGLVFGLSLSVASTVVLIRALKERGLLESINGRIAVGWLIVEDIITVLALVVLPVIAGPLLGAGNGATEGEPSVAFVLTTTLVKVLCFVVLMLIIGKRIIPRLLGRVARTGSRELFTIGVLAIALGVAFGAASLFDISPALGAFFAGVIISESDLSYQAGAEMLPFQEAFTVLFFVSVGMLVDPSTLVQMPWHVLLALAVIMVGKSLAALAIVLFFRFPFVTALTIAASLAQIGEFSFILIGVASQLEVVPKEALSIVVAAAVLSITLNPFVFKTLPSVAGFVKGNERLLGWLDPKGSEADFGPTSDEEGYHDHVLMIGYGRVGTAIGAALRSHDIPFIVVDQDRTVIDELRRDGLQAVFGDATRPGILEHAGVKSARLLIVATPSTSAARHIVEAARTLNQNIKVCVRTHDYADAVSYAETNVERIVLGELELAIEMAHFALDTYELDSAKKDETLSQIRNQGATSLRRGNDRQES